MTAHNGSSRSKLLGMALDDVDEVMRKDRAAKRPYRDHHSDYRGIRANDSRRLRNYDRFRQRLSQSKAPRPPTYIVKVTNLDHKVSRDDLMALFSTIGEIEKVWIDYDRTDRSMGSGGCIFKVEDDAKRAISEHDGSEFGGRIIEVSGEYQQPLHSRSRRQASFGVRAPW